MYFFYLAKPSEFLFYKNFFKCSNLCLQITFDCNWLVHDPDLYVKCNVLVMYIELQVYFWNIKFSVYFLQFTMWAKMAISRYCTIRKFPQTKSFFRCHIRQKMAKIYNLKIFYLASLATATFEILFTPQKHWF